MAIDVTTVKMGDKVWFDPGDDPCGWANHGFVNGKRMGPYIPCWTERQKGEATTFMVHASNVQAIEPADDLDKATDILNRVAQQYMP